MLYFAFSLARELGMTVGQLLSSMTARELHEWRAFVEIERSGGHSQATVDLDNKIRDVWANLCAPANKPGS